VVLGLAALDLVIAYHRHIWRAYDPDDYLERVNCCRRGAHDLVLIGGSTMSEGVNPAQLAGLTWHGEPLRRAYNLGLPGATLSEIWEAVEHGLAAPPRLLVYGITASDLNDDRREPHGPRTLMSAGDLGVWVHQRPQAGTWAVRQFIEGRLESVWQLYRYRNGIRLWAADQVEKHWPGLFPQSAEEARFQLRYSAAMRNRNGFAPHEGFQGSCYAQLKTCVDLGLCFPYLRGYRVGEYLGYLHRLLDWAQAHQVEIVLVDMPVSADLEQRLYPEAFAQFRTVLAEVERRRGVRVLRADRNSVGLGDTDFADLIHLNASGTRRLSAWLCEMLRKDGMDVPPTSVACSVPPVFPDAVQRIGRSDPYAIDHRFRCAAAVGTPMDWEHGEAVACGSTGEDRAWGWSPRRAGCWPGPFATGLCCISWWGWPSWIP
jgi:hypothetical protein